MADDFFNGAEDGDTAEFSTNGDADGTYSFSAQNTDSFSGSWAFEQYLEASGSGAAQYTETDSVSLNVSDVTSPDF